ncbi:MAG: hypothetical protein EOO77_27450 [Oxalobacteraceae bacterium]|nr:MAG: hypothetical protein EOO77_27450 [Oxalobacteraceae bacterium]
MPIDATPDPDEVPVRHITGAVSIVLNGQTVALNLFTDRMAVLMDGSVQPDPIVAARLRLDLAMAREIRDQLDAHLSGLTTSPRGSLKLN